MGALDAHIGIHTRTLAKHAHKVIAFEPNPNTFEILKKNVGHLENVLLRQQGVGSRDGVASFESKQMNCQSHIIEKYEDIITINVVALDNNISLDIPIGFIKIDVEGGEISAFNGMKQIIATHKPVIVFEDHIGDTVKYLRIQFNYKIQKLNSSNYIALP
jgi:FkbM family methyltransferase